MQFLIYLLPPNWLRTRHFSKPTFRPSRVTTHRKTHSVLRLFWNLDLLSTDPFSSDFFSSDSFSSLPLPTSATSYVHFVGSLTSKLPSANSDIRRQNKLQDHRLASSLHRTNCLRIASAVHFDFVKKYPMVRGFSAGFCHLDKMTTQRPSFSMRAFPILHQMPGSECFGESPRLLHQFAFR